MDIESERKAFEEKKQKKFNAKDIVSPDVSTRREIRKKLNDSAYFVIIGLISLISVFIPPLFSGCLSSDIGIAFPKTTEGWILWSVLNVSSAIANVSILILFKLQAKKNSMSDPNFQKANEIMNKLSGTKEVYIPRSPNKMNSWDYSRKTVSIIVSTFTSSIVLTSLILSFSWMTLLSCIVSAIISLCISWVTMINNERYWCEEYLLYAQMMEKQKNESQKSEELSNKMKED